MEDQSRVVVLLLRCLAVRFLSVCVLVVKMYMSNLSLEKMCVARGTVASR